ncbi:uncharacterized protein [Choristoneura fumiferana]|uniref:uncharacterized protein n=1 Tax=Choristoneura fumiferana TaxID=7141 RepID=UPI003D154F98
MTSVQITELTKETDELLRNLYKGHSEGFLQFGAGRFILPTSYREHAAPMRALPLRPDDVWVATFPRCGTTWTQELVWLVQNNLDYKKAAEISLLERYLFIELFTFMHEQLPVFEALDLDGGMGEVMKTPGYIMAEKMPSPRFIKTHLPMSLLSPNLLDTSKVVYVARDPRDAAVSFYYHNKRFKGHDYVGDFKSYWDLFQKDLIPWSPFWAHVKEAWALRYHPNMLFMFYEDMLKDLPAAIKRVAKFFRKTYSEQQIRTLCEHLDFKNFKNNSSVNFETMNHPLIINEGSEAFVRQGKAGGWAEHFDEDMRRQAREWVERHLQDTDLQSFFFAMATSEVEIRNLSSDTVDLLRTLFKGHSEGFLRFGPGGYVLPASYAAHADALRRMPLRHDDTWIVTCPRSGTTLAQEMVWLLKNSLDYDAARRTALHDRYNFIEVFSFRHEQVQNPDLLNLNSKIMEKLARPGYKSVETAASPRFLKSHLPLSLLPPALLDTCKLIYMTRDPRDVAVSYYHLSRLMKFHDYVGDFKSFWDLFIEDAVPYAPFFSHVKEAWAQRDHPNMLFMFYEDVIKDKQAAIRRVSNFFGREYSEDEVMKLCEHLDISNFKTNDSVNFASAKFAAMRNNDAEPFIRKGVAGSWYASFDVGMREQAARWMRHNLAGTDLRFPNEVSLPSDE